MIFTVFAVIGGISLDGGKGTMFSALTGVLLLGVVQNVLTLAQVPSFWIQAIDLRRDHPRLPMHYRRRGAGVVLKRGLCRCRPLRRAVRELHPGRDDGISRSGNNLLSLIDHSVWFTDR
jgi:hypothetical protein